MAKKRSPQQTLAVMLVLLGGIGIGFTLMNNQREQRKTSLADELPDLELVGLSPEELYAREDFTPHQGAPESWGDIHLRLYAEPEGIYLKFLRCTMDADEVVRCNPAAFKEGMQRRRESDELPPAWWPGRGETGDPEWAIPDWWRPVAGAGIGSWWAVPDQDTVVGVYLHYVPETHLLHYWEWRRRQQLVDPPPNLLEQPVVDQVATQLARHLATDGHPVVHGDWLHALDLPGPQVRNLVPGLPAGISGAEALLRPKRAMRYLLALHGLDQAQAETLLLDLPMRPVDPTQEPPVADWAFALPEAAPELPPWFSPGPGPRWRYELRRPGSGALDEARWAAYDPAAHSLLVWDWRRVE